MGVNALFDGLMGILNPVVILIMLLYGFIRAVAMYGLGVAVGRPTLKGHGLNYVVNGFFDIIAFPLVAGAISPLLTRVDQSPAFDVAYDYIEPLVLAGLISFLMSLFLAIIPIVGQILASPNISMAFCSVPIAAAIFGFPTSNLFRASLDFYGSKWLFLVFLAGAAWLVAMATAKICEAIYMKVSRENDLTIEGHDFALIASAAFSLTVAEFYTISVVLNLMLVMLMDYLW